MKDPLAIAKNVIQAEMDGLQALHDELDASFLAALEMIESTSGRIIVSGMGKSGLIGRKIAATFASTGTPAIYVHPGEASHGDLGMIVPSDIILALSKSGETSELGDLIGYAARFSIPIIAVTQERTSTLATASEVVLSLPDVPEACTQTGAPTTSTTVMLALGDALATALLQRHGVTASQFQGFHPGGQLGAALKRVVSVMHHKNDLELFPVAADDVSCGAAIRVLEDCGFGCVGLINDSGVLTGMLTDGDIRRLFGRDVADEPVGNLMTRDPKTVTAETLAGDALALMSESRITSLFVVADGKPVGLLHVHDCLRNGVI